MRTTTIATCVIALLFTGMATVNAGSIDIGDFRIGASDYTTQTAVDPGATHTTRSVLGAPVQIDSTWTVTSQNGHDAILDAGTDVAIRTWSSLTMLVNLNRYTSSTDGGASGVNRIGMAQWSFDLTPLDSYLSGNSLSLTALDLDLELDLPGGDGYEVFLSYTDAGAGTTLTSASATDPVANYGLWWAAESAGAVAGDIVNGQFEVLAMNQVADTTVSDSLLSLYGDGVREFNLMLMTPDYNSAQQTKFLGGISMDTIPEPATVSLVGVFGAALFIRRRRKG